MISTEAAFNELGVNAVTGVELMEWLGISPIDLGDSQRFYRFKEVINYFEKFPKDTQRFLVKRALGNKNVDKLSFMWEYTHLLKNREDAQESLAKIQQEGIAIGNTTDAVIRMTHAQREIAAKDEVSKINQEIQIYES